MIHRCGAPQTWTMTRHDGPNHLGFLCDALSEHQTALITSDCAAAQASEAIWYCLIALAVPFLAAVAILAAAPSIWPPTFLIFGLQQLLLLAHVFVCVGVGGGEIGGRRLPVCQHRPCFHIKCYERWRKDAADCM